MEEATLSIGQVASRAGVSVSTIRDWLRAANECRCESLEACALFVA